MRNVIDLQKLERLLKRHSKDIAKGRIFYRARISSRTGFKKNEMGNPPRDKATAGRANPAGISYLYLSCDLDTTLFETRATLFDFISIAEFRLKQNIRVVNLRGTEIFDPIPIAEAGDLEDFLVHYPFIARLEKEISKPNRRSDNEFDYLPTQYLSEFIKSLGFDGVEYKSSVNPKGYNIAVFDSDKFDCIKVQVREIEEVTFSHKALNLP